MKTNKSCPNCRAPCSLSELRKAFFSCVPADENCHAEMELRKAITNSMVEELSPVEKELSIAITNTMVGEMKHLVEVIKIGKE